jgi:hypothetical protein
MVKREKALHSGVYFISLGSLIGYADFSQPFGKVMALQFFDTFPEDLGLLPQEHNGLFLRTQERIWGGISKDS